MSDHLLMQKLLTFAGEEEEHFKRLFECIWSNGCYSFPYAKEDSVCVVSESSENPSGSYSHVQDSSVLASFGYSSVSASA